MQTASLAEKLGVKLLQFFELREDEYDRNFIRLLYRGEVVARYETLEVDTEKIKEDMLNNLSKMRNLPDSKSLISSRTK